MKRKDLRKWLRNKSVRMWKRTLLLLYEEDGPLSTDEIAEVIEANRSSVYNVLRKLEVSYRVKSKKANNRVTWTISDYGTEQIRNMQEKNLIPSTARIFSDTSFQ
jgi:predicted transcriptional regulator